MNTEAVRLGGKIRILAEELDSQIRNNRAESAIETLNRLRSASISLAPELHKEGK